MNDLEKQVIELSYRHKLTHVSSCLNCVNLIDFIYSQRKENDPFVLDSSHAALALYVVLEKYGFGSAEYLVKLHGVHASRDIERGIYVSGGSLGQPATIALGLALADKSRKVWLVTSDGSCMEGATYEAMRVGDKYCRVNLETFIVWNSYSAYGRVYEHELPRFSNVRVYHVDTRHYPPFLQGLQGHYIQLDDAQYAEAMS